MANTANFNLPLIDGSMTADVPRDMNALAEAVDANVRAAIDGAVVTVPDASTTQKGIVQLTNATDSTSETLAATPKAIKAAYDAATAAQSTANAAGTGLSAHASNTTVHITAAERATWNAAENNAKNASIPRVTRNTGDLNSITENGFYDGANMANAPSADWYYVEHMSHSQDPGNWRLQRATHFSSGVTYWRQLRAGTWTAWQVWGGGVKRVTRYMVEYTGRYDEAMYYVDLTIPAVDMSKTVVNVTGFRVPTGSDYVEAPSKIFATVQLVNPSTVRIQRGLKWDGNINKPQGLYHSFEVIEYN